MTDENKLQDTFAEACDKLNDAYVLCKSELNKLIDDNNNLRLNVMYYKTLLKECKGLFNRATVDGEEPSNGELIMILTKIEEALK